MAAKQTRHPPAFFWQGCLIQLPVLALAAASLVSLRQDERAAENEARRRAVGNVQSLARAMRVSVDEELHRFLTLQNDWMLGMRVAAEPSASVNYNDPKLSSDTFYYDGDKSWLPVFPDPRWQGDLALWERDFPGLRLAALALPLGEILVDGHRIEPPDFPAAPRPPKWFLELSARQMNDWQNLRAGGTLPQMAGWRQAFLAGQPSGEARQAVFDLFQSPDQLIGHSNSLPTETGISFEEIACCQLLTQTNAQLTAPLLHAVAWHTIDHTSLLSPKLLELAAALTNRADRVLQQRFFWLETYFTRQSLADACLDSLCHLPDLQPWRLSSWSNWTQDGSVLAIFQPTAYEASSAGHGYAVWLVPRTVVEAVFHRALSENQFLIPNYITTAVTVAGSELPSLGTQAVLDEKSLLAGADQAPGNLDLPRPAAWGMADTNSSPPAAFHFNVRFYLASRGQMLAAERQHEKWFGALILGAVFAAIVGLLAAQRAFRRQWQLNEEKSNFVSSVSHELRAPIAAVRLMAENLARGKISGPERQDEYFHFIVQECRRLSALIENVLDFSRIEQGRKQYEFEPANLAALAEATVKLLAPYAAEKGVRLEFVPDLRAPIAELLLDGRALQQAIVNLIDNAVKHSPPGETVTVGIACPDGNVVHLWVADHGPGIPSAEHEKIFERFYRLGSELRRETQGAGIGLSVVKHIIDAHGGRIRVHSEVGQGSRFTIELPAGQTTNDTNKHQ